MSLPDRNRKKLPAGDHVVKTSTKHTTCWRSIVCALLSHGMYSGSTHLSRASPSNSPVVLKTLDINYLNHKKELSFRWSLVNGGLLTILMYDLSYKSPGCTSYFYYLEYALITIFGLNTLYHTIKYLYLLLTLKPVVVNTKQKRLLGFKDSDTSFKLETPPSDCPATPPHSRLDDTSICSITPRSWRSSSPHSSHSPHSMTAASWQYRSNVSPPKYRSGASFNYSTCDDSKADIADEQSLNEYLRQYEEQMATAAYNSSLESTPNDLNSFWSHPSSRPSTQVSPMFRRTQYQLAPLNSSQTANKAGSEENSPNSLQISPQMWRLNVDPQHLTQWNLNLRRWISSTILERLVFEISAIDEALQRHGMADVRVGHVGLERLVGTARSPIARQHAPSLPTLLPFLQLCSNQEYLVQRIKELASGGCLSAFRWNRGGRFHDKDWEESLPTDSAIIMHLFATYMDSQLLPATQTPNGRPFTSQHLCKAPDKPLRRADALVIHQSTVLPPHYVIIHGEETIDVAKGRNNLIHILLLFLHTVSTEYDGMLGRVNLGISGINILWVIDR